MNVQGYTEISMPEGKQSFLREEILFSSRFNILINKTKMTIMKKADKFKSDISEYNAVTTKHF